MSPASKSLLELTDYLNYFDKEKEKLELQMGEELPEFYLPGWPKEVGIIEIKLGERKFVRPIAKDSAPRGVMVLEKCEADVEIRIKEDGAIMVRVQKYRKVGMLGLYKTSETEWSYDHHSKSHWSGGSIVGIPAVVSPSAFEKTACLIIFCQFLEEIKPTIVEILDEKLKRGQAAIEAHKELASEAQQCLAPLIPYIAAEKLAGN